MITADRGYRKENFLNLLTSFGLAAVLLMPDHILRCHPFVASSLLDPFRKDDEVDDEDMNAQSSTVRESDAGQSLVSVRDHHYSFCNGKECPFIVSVDSYVSSGCQVRTSMDEPYNCNGAERYTIRAHMIGEGHTSHHGYTKRFVKLALQHVCCNDHTGNEAW